MPLLISRSQLIGNLLLEIAAVLTLSRPTHAGADAAAADSSRAVAAAADTGLGSSARAGLSEHAEHLAGFVRDLSRLLVSAGRDCAACGFECLAKE